MSAHELLEPVASSVEQSAGAHDAANEPVTLGYWPLGKPLPELLTDEQLRLVLGVGSSQFYKLKKLGRFTVMETQLRLTTRTRYCGVLVLRFVRGEWTHARTFGAKRGPRLLTSHKAAFQSRSGRPQIAERADDRLVIREQLGSCVCGVSLGRHFDRLNNFLPCRDPRVTAAVHEAVSE